MKIAFSSYFVLFRVRTCPGGWRLYNPTYHQPPITIKLKVILLLKAADITNRPCQRSFFDAHETTKENPAYFVEQKIRVPYYISIIQNKLYIVVQSTSTVTQYRLASSNQTIGRWRLDHLAWNVRICSLFSVV